MSCVLVLVEQRQGAIRDVSFEMLTAARKLAPGGSVEAVLMAESCDTLAPAITPHANKVVCVTGPAFRDFNYESYQKALVKLAVERKPSAVMIANSAFGTDLGPSLQSRSTPGSSPTRSRSPNRTAGSRSEQWISQRYSL